MRTAFVRAVAAALASAHSMAAQSRCASGMDCRLNGRWTSSGVCQCKAWWTGENCTRLNLVPAASLHEGIWQQGVSTWGGSVIRSKVDGLYHAHVAEMLAGCGISAWIHNSQSVHFTSISPLGPYT
eukprot:SAG31_NODE_21494_length_548_cov_0.812918_1_plen_125_part_01